MVDRRRVLSSIKSKEQLEDYEKYLNRYLTEYNWFVNSKEPLESIRKKALSYDVGSDARNALENRARLIEIGQYGTSLERNITSYLLAVEEYKAKQENKSPYYIIKGIIQKDKKTLEYLKNRYMKSMVDNSGFALGSPVDLNIPSKEDILTQVFEQCDFINIQKPETSLVVVNAENNKLFIKVRETLKECLRGNGIETSNVDNKKFEIQRKDSNKAITNAPSHDNTTNKNTGEEIEI